MISLYTNDLISEIGLENVCAWLCKEKHITRDDAKKILGDNISDDNLEVDTWVNIDLVNCYTTISDLLDEIDSCDIKRYCEENGLDHDFHELRKCDQHEFVSEVRDFINKKVGRVHDKERLKELVVDLIDNFY